MSNYGVWGKLGAGKTKYAVWCARTALASGRRVAGNIDLHLAKLAPGARRAHYLRVPDKPKLADLEALGHGNPESHDEDRNGILILDELATWLNSRSFQDKSRQGVLDWLVHSRKFGWDVLFLMQGPGQIDKQVRESLLEYSVHMRKLDKVRLPMIGWLMQRVGLRGTFPRGSHWAQVRLGFDQGAMLVDSIIFKGADLHECYDTRQVFEDRPGAVAFSVLHPGYFDCARPAGARRRPPPAAARPKLPHVQAAMSLPPDVRVSVLRQVEGIAERDARGVWGGGSAPYRPLGGARSASNVSGGVEVRTRSPGGAWAVLRGLGAMFRESATSRPAKPGGRRGTASPGLVITEQVTRVLRRV